MEPRKGRWVFVHHKHNMSTSESDKVQESSMCSQQKACGS